MAHVGDGQLPPVREFSREYPVSLYHLSVTTKTSLRPDSTKHSKHLLASTFKSTHTPCSGTSRILPSVLLGTPVSISLGQWSDCGVRQLLIQDRGPAVLLVCPPLKAGGCEGSQAWHPLHANLEVSSQFTHHSYPSLELSGAASEGCWKLLWKLPRGAWTPAGIFPTLANTTVCLFLLRILHMFTNNSQAWLKHESSYTKLNIDVKVFQYKIQIMLGDLRVHAYPLTLDLSLLQPHWTSVIPVFL